MLIHHGATSGSPHSAPLGGPLGSHITLGHGSLPESCRDVGGSFSGRSGDAALPLVCLCLPRARYSRSDLNICKCCCGPPRHQRETPTSSSNPASYPTPTPSHPHSHTHTHIRAHHPSPFIFLAPFPFLSLAELPPPRPCGLTAVGTRSALSHRFILRRSETVNYQADTYSRSQGAGQNRSVTKVDSFSWTLNTARGIMSLVNGRTRQSWIEREAVMKRFDSELCCCCCLKLECPNSLNCLNRPQE